MIKNKMRTWSIAAGVVALGISGIASAHVNVGLNIGLPGVVVGPPPVVYAPPPPPVVYQAPPPVYYGAPPVLVVGWHGDRYWDGHRYWGRDEWARHHARRGRDWDRDHRGYGRY
jgi:hypothetical protein